MTKITRVLSKNVVIIEICKSFLLYKVEKDTAPTGAMKENPMQQKHDDNKVGILFNDLKN